MFEVGLFFSFDIMAFWFLFVFLSLIESKRNFLLVFVERIDSNNLDFKLKLILQHLS